MARTTITLTDHIIAAEASEEQYQAMQAVFAHRRAARRRKSLRKVSDLKQVRNMAKEAN